VLVMSSRYLIVLTRPRWWWALMATKCAMAGSDKVGAIWQWNSRPLCRPLRLQLSHRHQLATAANQTFIHL